jgi:hypothetical protein
MASPLGGTQRLPQPSKITPLSRRLSFSGSRKEQMIMSYGRGDLRSKKIVDWWGEEDNNYFQEGIAQSSQSRNRGEGCWWDQWSLGVHSRTE